MKQTWNVCIYAQEAKEYRTDFAIGEKYSDDHKLYSAVD